MLVLLKFILVTDFDRLLNVVDIKVTDVVIFGEMDVWLTVLIHLNWVKLWGKDVLNFPVFFLLLHFADYVNPWLGLEYSYSFWFRILVLVEVHVPFEVISKIGWDLKILHSFYFINSLSEPILSDIENFDRLTGELKNNVVCWAQEKSWIWFIVMIELLLDCNSILINSYLSPNISLIKVLDLS